MRVLSRLNQGENVTCPVCEHSYSKFLPYGRVARENALCPNCHALERHRLIWLFLKEKTDFFSARLRVLHIAPEHCFIDRFEALPNLDYITADIESPLAKVKMDIHDIPFPENSFDVVFCNHVLEHVKDDLKVCSELNRVLKPDGWGILQSPVYQIEKTLEDHSILDAGDRERVFGQRDHVRKYGTDYAQRLRLSGIQISENLFVKEIDPVLSVKFALPINETLFICQKKV